MRLKEYNYLYRYGPQNLLVKYFRRFSLQFFSKQPYYENYFTYRFSYKHSNFSHSCLLVKMACKTVTKPCHILYFGTFCSFQLPCHFYLLISWLFKATVVLNFSPHESATSNVSSHLQYALSISRLAEESNGMLSPLGSAEFCAHFP